MAKQIAYSSEAREKLKKGIDAVAKAVGTTLGPKGRNVALDKKWGSPSVVHDGVSVAKEIELEDAFENMGAQLIKEAADKTNDVTGDGTTTATILAQAIVNEGIKNLTAGANPMILNKGIEKAASQVLESIKKQAHPIKDNSDKITQVATISAQNEEIGNKIAEALKKVGSNGVVTVEEGKGLELVIDYKEGMEFDKGFSSAYFITNPDTMEATIEDAYILLTDKKISSIQELLPFLEKLVKVSKNLVIIADEVDGEALATLVVNKLRGTFNVLAVEAPGFGDRRKEMLQDIAILTGGQVVSEELGSKLENADIPQLGRARRVVAKKEDTTIVEGKGKKEDIKARIEQVKKELEVTESEFDKEKLQERLAKLSGGVAVIKVGAATEIEQKQKQQKIEDAIAATRAAVEEGVVPGGGVALIRCVPVLDEIKVTKDQKIGLAILKKVLEAPLRKIAQNAGMDEGVVANRVKEEKGGFGFNARTNKFENLLKTGIIDPTKVVRLALQNAASAAGMLLTTECVVAEKPEEKKEGPTPSMPGEY